MTEDEVQQVAEDYVRLHDQDLLPCRFAYLDRIDCSSNSITSTNTNRHDWVVHFQFIEDGVDEGEMSACFLMVIVDDATGEASFIDSL